MRRKLSLACLAALCGAITPALAETPATSLPAVEASLIAPAIRVHEAARVAAFYQQALGMIVLMSRDVGAIHETMLAFANTPNRPAIMLVSNARPGARPLAGTGATRLVIRVSSMAAVVTRLDAARIAHAAPSEPQRGATVLHIGDPEHNDLELVESSPAPRPAA